MDIKGKLEAIAASKKYGTDQVDGTIIKIEGSDLGWIKSRDYRSKIAANKGDIVSVRVDESEFKGKTYYNFKAENVKVLDGSGSAPATPTPSKKSTGYDAEGPIKGMCFNNAVSISITNKKSLDDEFIKAQYQRLMALHTEVTSDKVADSSSNATVEVEEDDLDDIFAVA